MGELKVQELERRIKVLEEQSARATFNYYQLSKCSKTPKNEHDFFFNFEVKSNCYLMVECAVNGAIDGFLMVCSINGTEVFREQNCQMQTKVSKLLPFKSGLSSVEIRVIFESDSTVENCTFTTFGNLSYEDAEGKLSVINESQRSIFLFLANQRLTINKYDGEVTQMLSFDGVNSATIAPFEDNYLMVAVGLDGVATAHLYDQQFALINSAELDSDVSCVCSTGGSPAIVYSVRGNRVYRYSIYQDLSVVITQTEYRAKSVTANSCVSDYIIITDHAGNGKLIKIQ